MSLIEEEMHAYIGGSRSYDDTILSEFLTKKNKESFFNVIKKYLACNHENAWRVFYYISSNLADDEELTSLFGDVIRHIQFNGTAAAIRALQEIKLIEQTESREEMHRDFNSNTTLLEVSATNQEVEINGLDRIPSLVKSDTRSNLESPIIPFDGGFPPEYPRAINQVFHQVYFTAPYEAAPHSAAPIDDGIVDDLAARFSADTDLRGITHRGSVFDENATTQLNVTATVAVNLGDILHAYMWPE